MNNTKLIISIDEDNVKLFEQEIDFFQSSDLSPRIFKQFFNISNFENTKGDYTLNLKLPKTIRNLKAFNFIGDHQSADNFFNFRKYKARIEVNNSNVLTGTLTIDEITPDHLEATIIGDNISWANLLGDRTLRDLTNLPHIKYSGLQGTSFNAWPENASNTITLRDVWNTYEDDSYKVQFPLVSYGNFSSDPKDSTPNPLTGNSIEIRNSNGIQYGSVIWRPWNWPFDPLEFKPAGYFKTIFRAIFEEQGYSVVGDFIEDPDLDNLILPYVDSANAEPNLNWGLLASAKVRGTFFAFSTNDGNPNNQPPAQNWQTPVEIATTNPLDFTNNIGSQTPISNQTAITISQLYDRSYVERKYDYIYQYAPDLRKYVIKKSGRYRIRYSVSFEQFSRRYWDSAFTESERINRNNVLKLGIWVDSEIKKINWTLLSNGQIDDLIDGLTASTPQVKALSANLVPFADVNISTFQGSGGGKYYQIEYDYDGRSFTVTADVDLQKFDTVTGFMFCSRYLHQIQGSPATDSYVRAEYGDLTITPLTELDGTSFDQLLSVAKVLPDIKIKDFIKSTIKMFNLFYTLDNTSKTIGFYYPSTYFYSNATAIDWSSKTDISLASVSPANSYKFLNFEFAKEDGEVLIIPANYDYHFISSSTYYTDTKDIDVIFAPTAIRNYHYIWQSPNDNFSKSIPTMNTKDELAYKLGDIGSAGASIKYDYKPRILKWEGFIFTGDQGQFWVGDRNDPYTYLWNMGNGLDVYMPMTSILPWLNWNTLYQDYYAKQVFNTEKSIQIEIPIMLNELDVANADFRRPIIINNQLYILSAIDNFDPVESKPTKVKLFKK